MSASGRGSLVLLLPSDERRDRWLQRQGYAVLRLSDALVLSSIGVAVALIAEQVVPLRS